MAISASSSSSWVHTGKPAKLWGGGVMYFQFAGIYLSSIWDQPDLIIYDCFKHLSGRDFFFKNSL
jgi:hypothetical protein